jgi:hypothetical protein
MITTENIRRCWNIQWKILTFRASSEELLSLGKPEFLWGLFWVWLAGIGRAWDNPHAHWLLRSGLPSVFYIFALSGFLWLFILFLRPSNWSYRKLLIFISMTGMPALLYAIPLEMMLSPYEAATGNAYLLLIVACWRVALLAYYLFRVAGLYWLNTMVALCLPLFSIVNVLIAMDQFEKTFAMMGGIRYVVLTDPKAAEEAKKERQRKRESDLQTLRAHGQHVTLKDLTPPWGEDALQPVPDPSGKAQAQVYTEFTLNPNGPPPPGYSQVQWDDARYLPPTPLMAILRPLKTITTTGFPILLAYYLVAAVVINARLGRKPKSQSDV